MNEDELINILNTAREKNARHNFTGVLLYSGGTFIQVLEGDEDEIDNIFDIIEQDKRHKNVLKLMEEIVTERTFPDWTMGFSIVDPVKAKELIGFLQSNNGLLANDNPDNAVVMIKTFINTNNLLTNS